MPIAIVAGNLEQAAQAADGLQEIFGDLFDLRPLASSDQALEQVRDRTVVAAYILPSVSDSNARLLTSQAAGASQQQLAQSVFGQVAAGQGVTLDSEDIAPLSARDSAGSVSMFLAQG